MCKLDVSFISLFIDVIRDYGNVRGNCPMGEYRGCPVVKCPWENVINSQSRLDKIRRVHTPLTLLEVLNLVGLNKLSCSAGAP